MGYENGKIYKITGGGMTYYGSTTQPLYKRFYQHKSHKKCSSKIIMETGEEIIVLVELYPCKSKEELFSRERWYIENNDCINIVIPMRTNKEYKMDNANKIKEQQKQYRIENADTLNTNAKQYRIENADKIKENKNNYRIKNADKIKEQEKQYRNKIADKIKENKKNYRIKNADKIKEQRRKYYLKKKGLVV